MTAPPTDSDFESPSDQERCLECERLLTADEDREVTEDGVFCRSCFSHLTRELQFAVQQQGEGINYPAALTGGIVGGIIGAFIWFGFTMLTKVSFGLVAVVIGFAVGKGVVMMSGGKRGPNLQFMSAGIAAIAYFYASYLVNRGFVLAAIEENPGLADPGFQLPWLADPALMWEIVGLNFGIMDLVFLAIVVWQAWRMPAPFRLPG